jgi:predicted ArsR family transcriptional regulator
MRFPALINPGQINRTSPNKTRYCAKKGCEDRTREGKDYCPEHIESLPYVKQLMDRIEKKEAEVANVRKKGKKAVDPKSENLKEVRTHLEFNGSRTKKRLARELQLTSSGMEGFLDYLDEEEEITRSRTSRGDETIHLL